VEDAWRSHAASRPIGTPNAPSAITRSAQPARTDRSGAWDGLAGQRPRGPRRLDYQLGVCQAQRLRGLHGRTVHGLIRRALSLGELFISGMDNSPRLGRRRRAELVELFMWELNNSPRLGERALATARPLRREDEHRGSRRSKAAAYVGNRR
jgi:hypothetical protein